MIKITERKTCAIYLIKNFLQNVNSTVTYLIFVDKSIIFPNKRWIILKYLLNLMKYFALTMFTYRLSKWNRFFHRVQTRLSQFNDAVSLNFIVNLLFVFHFFGKIVDQFLHLCVPSKSLLSDKKTGNETW